MLCFAMITAEYVAGKAARDALYLAHLDVTTLQDSTVKALVADLVPAGRGRPSVPADVMASVIGATRRRSARPLSSVRRYGRISGSRC